MTCDRFEEQLARHADGELGCLQAWQVRAHLRRCPHCAAEAEETEALDRGMRAAFEASEPPHYMTAAVMRRLPAMPPAQRPAWHTTRGRALRWVVGISCAAAQVAGLWGAYRFGYSRAEQRQLAPVPALLGAAAANLWVSRKADPDQAPNGTRRRGGGAPLSPLLVR